MRTNARTQARRADAESSCQPRAAASFLPPPASTCVLRRTHFPHRNEPSRALSSVGKGRNSLVASSPSIVTFLHRHTLRLWAHGASPFTHPPPSNVPTLGSEPPGTRRKAAATHPPQSPNMLLGFKRRASRYPFLPQAARGGSKVRRELSALRAQRIHVFPPPSRALALVLTYPEHPYVARSGMQTLTSPRALILCIYRVLLTFCGPDIGEDLPPLCAPCRATHAFTPRASAPSSPPRWRTPDRSSPPSVSAAAEGHCPR
ncbi:hypothetical protein EVG20_g8583 [Dentipellis fragilis]|uniref:Uncharacterized protein n=1 Tax=Dentipellis fragilis TaxID=205917 RepID=A0A4Y9Y6E4_9AGAM|nr:hypothetical protein EVG20_g8583 [Dentipellis fragilis]